MNERDIAAEVAEGLKELEKIRNCQHRWEMVGQPRYTHYIYKCSRCGAEQFAVLEGQI